MNIQSVLAAKGAHVITIRPAQSIREALTSLVTHAVLGAVCFPELFSK